MTYEEYLLWAPEHLWAEWKDGEAVVFTGGPDLMVEVISADSTHRDRVEKREECAQAGVREYWVIEAREGKRRRRSVMVYRLDDAGQYGPGEIVHTGVVHSTVLPGFWLPVEWLWQAAAVDLQTLLATILRHPAGPDGPEVREPLHTQPWAMPILQEGRAEGIEVGRAEGMEIGIARGLEVGRVEGLRTSIRLVLTARFGGMPPSLERAIQGITRDEDLTALLRQATLAPTIDVLSGRWESH
jgi:hypothetical protein